MSMGSSKGTKVLLVLLAIGVSAIIGIMVPTLFAMLSVP